MRAHLPLLLALSVNSPFWQGRDTGLASARTPLFQAFPRVGIPRAFRDYADWVEAVDLLIRCDAFPEPTFLWWDVRPQPRFGTVEVRILDAQTTVAETAALAALVQCIARLEVEEGYVSEPLMRTQEALDENRFIAARDGMEARADRSGQECRVPARELLGGLLEACAPHAVRTRLRGRAAHGVLDGRPHRRPAPARSRAQRQRPARAGERPGRRFLREGYTVEDGTPRGRDAADRSRAG